MPNNETVDIDTFEGQYRYVGEYLRKTGADSQTFSCLSRMKQIHDFIQGKLNDADPKQSC